MKDAALTVEFFSLPKRRRFFFFWITLALGMMACGRETPMAIQPGEYQCQFCKMGITNMRFKAQILSPKGKVYSFDSIECMVAWGQANPKDSKHYWVSDFYKPEVWISMKTAIFLKSEKISSPMGAFLSAYPSLESAQAAQQTYGGAILSVEEVYRYIDMQWKSTSTLGNPPR